MENTIAAVRGFNRFYTGLVGALDANFLGTEVTLPEARLLFEIATREPATASTVQAAMKMDAGYVSRILARFEERGWISRGRDNADTRTRPITLTDAGRETFATLDNRQRGAVADRLAPLGSVERADLVQALARVRLLLDPGSVQGYVIRTFRAGDIGMIAARQSLLYDESHGWGRGLEVVASEVTTTFLRNFKPGREQCWIAEIDGVMAGSVFLTDEGNNVAGYSRLMQPNPPTSEAKSPRSSPTLPPRPRRRAQRSHRVPAQH